MSKIMHMDEEYGGYIVLPDEVEELTVTLKNNFTLTSWGYCRAYKVGGLCIFTFSGLQRSTETTTNTTFATISGITAKKSVTSVAVNGSTDTAMFQIAGGGSNILMNSMSANIGYYGEIVFPI